MSVFLLDYCFSNSKFSVNYVIELDELVTENDLNMPHKSNKRKKTINRSNMDCNSAPAEVYFQKIYKAAKIVGCTHGCSLLSKRDRKDIYMNRTHLTQPKVAPGHLLSYESAKELAFIFREYRKSPSVTLVKGQDQISIDEGFAVESVVNFLEGLNPGQSSEKLRTAFAPLVQAFKNMKNPLHSLYDTYDFILAAHNVCNRQTFGVATDVEYREFPVSGVYHLVWMKLFYPQKKALLIDGKRRPVFRLGWPNWTGKVDYQDLDTSLVGNLYKGNKAVLDIYIQSHAIRRFHERLDCLPLTFINTSMMLSFKYEKDVQVFKNKILFPYSYYGIILGYFLADIIEDTVVIRTFLFITHHHTPEGQKLERLMGLNKNDISYWKIDRLDTFMTSSLKEDDALMEIFDQAGLAGLFEMDEVDLNESIVSRYDWSALEEYIVKGQVEQEDVWEEDCVDC